MPWITPKTNWIAADGVANTDLNRVEANSKFLYDEDGTTLGGVNGWKAFRANGGTIANGGLSVLGSAVRTNRQWFDFHDGKTGIFSPTAFRIGLNAAGKQIDLMTDGGITRFEPFHDNEYHLGNQNFRWKEIWVGGTFHRSTAGYIKLPNGMLLQWGRDSGTQANIAVNFPILYPEVCYVVTCQIDASVQSSVITNNIATHGFNAVIASPAPQTTLLWVAIGK